MTEDRPPSYDDDDCGLDLDEPPGEASPSDSSDHGPKSGPRDSVTPRASKHSIRSAGSIASSSPHHSLIPKPIKTAPAKVTSTQSPAPKNSKSIPPTIKPSPHQQSRADINEEKSYIEHLEQLNKTLVQQLEEKDKQLSHALQDNSMNNLDELTDAAMKIKIVSLVKKNKTISLSYEKEKTRVSKLQAEVMELQQRGEKSFSSIPPHPSIRPPPSSLHSLSPSPSSHSIQLDDRELRELRDSNTKLMRQYTDTKDKLQATQTEINKLRKILVREVGESVDIEKILSDENTASWKGRAQQITILKAKIRELSSVGETNTTGDMPRYKSGYDDAHRGEIGQLAAERRQEFDRLSQQLEISKEELQKQKTKLEAKESRIKILEAKVHELQEKMKVVLDKTENDDKLILLLKKELQKLKK